MTCTNCYALLSDLKMPNRLNISDSNSDDMLEGILEDASRDIDGVCHRWFYTDADSDDPQAFYYTAQSTRDLFVDDIRTATDLTIEIDYNNDGVYETLLTTVDYILEPSNALAKGQPFRKITLRANNGFPKDVPNGVKVTAHWGWASVPTSIQQATLLWAERLFKRFATPIGSEAMTALGQMRLQIPSDDPDVVPKIGRFIKIQNGFG